jgi:hypothetical protein
MEAKLGRLIGSPTSNESPEGGSIRCNRSPEFRRRTAPPVSYTQSGSVVDVEAVTVPVGTFTAIKLQSTVTWTSPGGATRTQTVTNWRDVATSYCFW